MPPKVTRESIEAELSADERARCIKKMQDAVRDFDELESKLHALEDDAGFPTFYRSKPLVERMAHVGMSDGAITQVRDWLAAISTIVGPEGPNRLPDHVKKQLAETADAELSALDQLDDIVRAKRKRQR